MPYHKDNTIILPSWSGDMDDRALYDILPFLLSISQKPVDVRDELKKVGRTNTAEYFNRMQAQRRQTVMEMRQKGIVGAMTSIEKLNKEDTAPRMTRERMEQNRILFDSK